MSAVAHIKEEIMQLTSTDRRELEEFLRSLAQQEAQASRPQPGRKLSHEEAMDYVFTEFTPVLAKLAQ